LTIQQKRVRSTKQEEQESTPGVRLTEKELGGKKSFFDPRGMGNVKKGGATLTGKMGPKRKGNQK